MSEAPDIWMPLYIGRYLRKTSRLSRDQHGAYLLLLMDYWVNGPPPDDDGQLAAVVKATAKEWAKLRAVLAPYFQIREGRWHSERADTELAKAQRNTELRSSAGKASAAAKRQRRDKEKTNKSSTDVGTYVATDVVTDVATELSTAPSTALPLECQQTGITPPSPSKKDVVVVGAREPSPPVPANPAEPEPAKPPLPPGWFEIGEEVCRLAGIKPGRLVNDFAELQRWAQAGFDPALDVLACVRMFAADAGHPCPTSIKYLTPIIGKFHHDRVTDFEPIPGFLRRSKGDRDERTSTGNAYLAALAELEGGDREQPVPGVVAARESADAVESGGSLGGVAVGG